MSGVPITGTLDPQGAFPAVDALDVKGSFRSVADNTERNAIASYLRVEGMIVHVIATGVTWQLKASPWAYDDTDWQIFPNLSVVRQRFTLVEGVHSTDLQVTSPLIIGAGLYEPVSLVAQSDPRTRTVLFTALVETSDAASTCYVDLFDVNAPAVVTSSEISTTSTTPVAITMNVTAYLGSVYSTTLLEVRLWQDNPATGRLVTCKAAYLDLLFS